MKWLVLLFALSLLPIWRGAGHSRHEGMNLWVMLGEAANQKHITYSEALRRARLAHWEELADGDGDSDGS